MRWGGMSAPSQAPSPSTAGDSGSVRRSGITIYQGKELSYEVVTGLAIHGGDMVLGTAEQAAAASHRRRSTKRADPDISYLSPEEAEYHWPGGVIPYVIDPEFTELAVSNIQRAIDEWNSKTVITLVREPRNGTLSASNSAKGPPFTSIVTRRSESKEESKGFGSTSPTVVV